MTDSSTSSDENKEESKTSELAIASFVIPVFLLSVWLAFIIFICWYGQDHHEFPTLSNVFLLLVAFLISITVFLLAVPVFALMAIVRIRKNNGSLNGYIFAYLGLVLSLLELGFLGYFPVRTLIEIL
jgi:hypothetical protein